MLKIFATYTKGKGRKVKTLAVAHALDPILMDKGLFGSQLYGMESHQQLISEGWKLETQAVGRE